MNGRMRVLGLEEKEMVAALAMSPEHPVWLTLREVFAEAEEEAVRVVSAYQTTEKPMLMAHTAGGIEALRDVWARLEALRSQGVSGE
jgi:hypothetical protein